MNTVRAFKRFVSRAPSNADPHAASSIAAVEAMPANIPTQAAPSTAEVTSSFHGYATPAHADCNNEHPTYNQYPNLPNMPPDITKTASRHASSAGDPAKHATSQLDPSDGREGRTTSNQPLEDNGRPKLNAKRQHGRLHKPDSQYTHPDLASKIVTEEFDNPEDPKPKGYLGTIAGARICASSIEDYCPCGTGGGHYLVCGHTVVSDSGDITCGANCKAGLHSVQPFSCPECRRGVNEILENKLTVAEQDKIKFHHSGQRHALAIALSVEYVSKNMPTANGNISETLISIAMPDYGRACQLVPDEVNELTTLVDIYQAHCKTMEQKGHARHVEIETGPLNAPGKRKTTAAKPQTPVGPNIGSQAPLITPESPTVASFAEKHNKRQKMKLKTYPEPITESSRGTKRNAVKDGQSEMDGNASLRTPTTNKKLKTKLETHRQPITPRTRGIKRGLGNPPVFADTLRASKRVSVSPPQDLGPAHFLPIPVGLGDLEHKRGQDAPGADYSNKRRRSSELLPGSHMKATFAPVDGKKRISLSDYVAMGGDD